MSNLDMVNLKIDFGGEIRICHFMPYSFENKTPKTYFSSITCARPAILELSENHGGHILLFLNRTVGQKQALQNN